MTTLQSRPAARIGRLRRYLAELWTRREFAWFLAMGNLKARHASTAFGLFWWVLNPLLLGAVYYIVFGLIFPGRRPDDFIPYLLTGLFVFHFTHQSMTGGANSILQNAKLLANLRFPRMVLPIAYLLESAVGFLTSLGVLLVVVIPFPGVGPTTGMLLLPVVMLLHAGFNLGLGAIAARLAVPFRDITNFIPYLTRLWLYMSPVIWPLEMLGNVSPELQSLIRLNPMFDMIGVYHTAFLGYPFDPAQLLTAAVWAAVVAVVGVGMFVKYEGHIVRYL